jgi:hypothetical protein
MSSLVDMFTKRRSKDPEPTPRDRLVGVERETARLLAEQARLTTQIAGLGTALAELDVARQPLAFAAKVDGDADAGRRLADANTRRRQLDDERRDSVDALAQLTARLDALAGERREAEHLQNIECVRRLCKDQAQLAAKLDSDFTALAERTRRWIELDVLIVDHATRIGAVSSGRAVLSRVQDILSHHLYAALPAMAQAHAVDLRIGLTEARRGATFTQMSQQHGPASALLARASETKEMKR